MDETVLFSYHVINNMMLLIKIIILQSLIYTLRDETKLYNLINRMYLYRERKLGIGHIA